MIIVIGNEKGGTGKTTIATNLAAMAAGAGKDVVLVDTDKQGSATAWAGIRLEGEVTPPVRTVSLFGKTIYHELSDLRERYDAVIVDAGGRDSIELRGAAAAADRLYAPVQAAQFDLWALERLAEIVNQAGALNPGLTAHVLITRASTNPVVGETREAQEFLADLDGLDLVNTVIRDRIAYRRAAREGLAVAELKPTDTKARTEMQFFYEEVFGNERIQASA